MTSLSLLATALFVSAFGRAVRLDQENRPGHACYHADIAVSQGISPIIYCAFEDDSVPFTIVSSDIALQRSTDLGQIWLPENIIVARGRPFACYPDLKLSSDGTLLLVFLDRIDGSRGHVAFTRSSDSGQTWSTPVQVDDNSSFVPMGWARLALDSSDNVFCTWTDQRGENLRVFADVSTDRGETWGTDVRVDDDTVDFNCYPPDCYVQPGTNHYLVTAVAPVRGPSGIVLHSHFYKSTDRGRSFSPGFQLDTFHGYSQQPHVVADEGHIITDYGGNGYLNQCVTMARTWFAASDSWGEQVMVTELDTIYSSFTNGAKLAIDQDSRVHTGLMIAKREEAIWNIYYAQSTDAGLTWSEREPVSPLPLVQQWDPTIAVDDLGNAYLAWQDMRESKAEIWFATNACTGLAEDAPKSGTNRLQLKVMPWVCRGLARLQVLAAQTTESSRLMLSVFDPAGRRLVSQPLEDRSPPISLDLRLPCSGSYLVQVTDGRETASARILVLKD
ncbi:MAG: exo-alpha-sialidase [candidate division WOR-3 bacterium]